MTNITSNLGCQWRVALCMLPLWFAMATFPATAADPGPTAQLLDFPRYGVRLIAPAGFTARELEGGLLLAAEKFPGIVLISAHEHRALSGLRAQAEAGLGDGVDTALKLDGTIRTLGDSALTGDFRGKIDKAEARAAVVGLINPHGDGLTVMAATTPAQFGAQHRSVAEQIARSVEFYLPKPPAIVDEWRAVLGNRRLAHHFSSYSSGRGGYSGFQASQEFHLCAAGRFLYGARESGSTDGGGAYGSTRSRSAAQGAWAVVADSAGLPWLQLRYNAGAIENYRLTMVDGSTRLNGDRHFRTATDRCQ